MGRNFSNYVLRFPLPNDATSQDINIRLIDRKIDSKCDGLHAVPHSAQKNDIPWTDPMTLYTSDGTQYIRQ